MVNMESEFVSLVSHELRTPLTSIKGYIDYLLEKPDRFGAEDTECLQIVQKNARRLMELVNDLLDVSRLEEGKVQLQRTVFDLEELVEEVVQSLQPQLLAKAHELMTQSPPERTLVLADRQRIAQVLTNLLSNACKYTPDHGRITLILEPEDEQLRVAVCDNGIGMTVEEQAKLFTKFYRANNKAAQEVGGTGLGLVIAHMLVQLHGGDLQVESAPSEGTTFSMMLPLAQKPSTQGSSVLPAHPLTGMRLLIVEDNPNQQALFQRLLSRYGCQVFFASTGHESIQQAETEHPELICLDMLLSDYPGLQALETLKSQPTTQDIPVMLISTDTDSGEGYILGTVEHLYKPTSEELLRRVRTILGEQNESLVLLAQVDPVALVHSEAVLRQADCRLIEAHQAEMIMPLIIHYHPQLVLLDNDLLGTDDADLLCRVLLASADNGAEVLLVGALPDKMHAQWDKLLVAGCLQQLGARVTSEQIVAAIIEKIKKREQYKTSEQGSRESNCGKEGSR